MPCPFAYTVQLFYGSLGDAIALTATAPLERAIVLRQTANTTSASSLLSSSSSSSTVNTNTTLSLSWLSSWTYLWNGNGLAIASTILGKTLTQFITNYLVKNHRRYFLDGGSHDKSRNSILEEAKQEAKQEQHPPESMTLLSQPETKAGIVAGCISIVILYPLNYALTRIICDDVTNNRSVQDILIQTIQCGGIGSLYNGLGMALAGFLNFQILYIELYDRLVVRRRKMAVTNHHTNDHKETDEPNTSTTFMSSTMLPFLIEQFVSALACCFAYPLETNCRRLQQQQQPSSSSLSSEDLYAGFAARLLKTFLCNSILMAYNSERMGSSTFLRRLLMKIFH